MHVSADQAEPGSGGTAGLQKLGILATAELDSLLTLCRGDTRSIVALPAVPIGAGTGL
jgi:hypothetical protein